MTRDEMQLKGVHNVENVLAALAAGLACGAAPDSMRETVRRFAPVEHRLERVAEIGGVTFYNDSKATNVDATVKAVEALAEEPGQIVLILGGRGKNAPYAPLAPLVRSEGARARRHRRGRRAHRGGVERVRADAAARHGHDRRRPARFREAATRRHGAARPGLRELRHVRELRASRARVQGGSG